ncbi:vitamin K epoxide reductase family protein [Trueperella bialowiezensis]|uniref:VKOR family protein n=1 Tax=Trueperella bialowiezensis TaxID=312285 RepID=A0A448PGM0_9ACTO|nr:vitamin K epoxide reductase family protein [Trueperella bialowiezensis]VEI14085.1 VKOR family protein [Trueperella bialowiezensis]
MANTSNDLDDLDIAELDRRLAKLQAKATEHEKAGGASRETGIVWVVASFVGMFAAFMLLLAERAYLKNPAGDLLCDINPLVGCSSWFTKWQGTLFFDVPNALWGALFFAGMVGLGLVLVTGGRMHRLLWLAASAGTTLGMVWVLWFGYQSYGVERSICPYCVVVWLAVIPLFVHVVARTLQAGHLGAGAARVGSTLVRDRWVIVGVIYGLLVIATVVAFWDVWDLVF